MKKCTLFIGNGLNRISHDRFSWEAVVQNLACSVGKEVGENNTKPFPLLYEELFLQYAKSSGNEDDFKKLVAEFIKEMRPNELHKQIADAGFNHILTTNYDYWWDFGAIKKAGKNMIPSSFRNTEIRYSLFRRHLSGDTSIWHIHGEIKKHKTINLGYEHYVGALSKMRDYTFWDQKGSPDSDKHSAFMQGITDFDARSDIKYAWTDLFLRDDIHIVGFGLDYCEIDLWWLLVVKERLKHGAFDSAKKYEVGKTYYYYTDADVDTDAKADRISMLKSLGVQLEHIALVNDDWKKFYKKAIDYIMTRKHA